MDLDILLLRLKLVFIHTQIFVFNCLSNFLVGIKVAALLFKILIVFLKYLVDRLIFLVREIWYIFEIPFALIVVFRVIFICGGDNILAALMSEEQSEELRDFVGEQSTKLAVTFVLTVLIFYTAFGCIPFLKFLSFD